MSILMCVCACVCVDMPPSLLLRRLTVVVVAVRFVGLQTLARILHTFSEMIVALLYSIFRFFSRRLFFSTIFFLFFLLFLLFVVVAVAALVFMTIMTFFFLHCAVAQNFGSEYELRNT